MKDAARKEPAAAMEVVARNKPAAAAMVVLVGISHPRIPCKAAAAAAACNGPAAAAVVATAFLLISYPRPAVSYSHIHSQRQRVGSIPTHGPCRLAYRPEDEVQAVYTPWGHTRRKIAWHASKTHVSSWVRRTMAMPPRRSRLMRHCFDLM